MGRIFAAIICLVFFVQSATAQDRTEVTLYDRNGVAIAYLAPGDDHTLYLFDGTPLAYLLVKAERYYVYGFNGKHLGWFDEGILRDKFGDAVGCQKDVITMHYESAPIKA